LCKISIIIPTYNRPTQLKNTLKSLEDQVFKDFEVLIVNDCGEDTSYIVDECNTSYKVSYYSLEKNLGPGGARNCGLDMVKSEYVSFLDDDNTYKPNHLQLVVDYLDNNLEVDFVYTNIEKYSIGANGHIMAVSRSYEKFSYERIMISNLVDTSSMCFRKKVADSVRFDTSLKRIEDWDFALSVIHKGFKVHNIPNFTINYTITPENIDQIRNITLELDMWDNIHKKHKTDSEYINEERRKVLVYFAEFVRKDNRVKKGKLYEDLFLKFQDSIKSESGASIDILLEMESNFPRDGEVLYSIYKLYNLLGDEEKSKEYLKKTKELDKYFLIGGVK
jgi:glycosyltransferase involved in cell wall biosynthesis